MISKRAIRQFLDARRDDHRYLKKLGHKKLDGLLYKLAPRLRLHPKIGLHQKVGVYLGLCYRSFAFFYDMGCVDGETEYLTPSGWRKIKNYKQGRVAQYDPQTRSISFVNPSAFIDRPCEEMYHFKSARGCDQMVSSEHNMLVVAEGPGNWIPGSRGKRPADWKHSPVGGLPEYRSSGHPNPYFYRATPAEVLEEGVRFETTFLYDGPGVWLTDAQIRVQVAVHADGYLVNKSKVVVSVKKERKKRRLRRLLRDAAIPYTERRRDDGYSGFRFSAPEHTKLYGPRWWLASLSQKRVICDEVGYWDGSARRARGVSFFSRSKSCADFIQFCFSSTRRRAFLGESKSNSQGRIDYTVHAFGDGRTTNLAMLRNGRLVAAPEGRKYCFEVPSHYLVLRRNGNVFVTGNTGKTLLSLELLQYLWDTGKLRRALVFVTSDKAFPTWERQCKEYGVTVPYCVLDSTSSAGKWKTLKNFGDGIIFLHYPGAVAMVSGKASSRAKRKSLLLDDVDRLLVDVDAVIYDEVTKAANPNSLTYQLCWKASKAARYRFALAGMPFGRDPTPLWAEMNLVDHGETLGETLGLFQAAFFRERSASYGGGKEYKFRSEMEGTLSEVIQHNSITYTANECIDLPPEQRIPVPIKLTREIKDYYREVIEEAIAAKGDRQVMKNAFLRMRQLSSGFIGLKDDETGEKSAIEFERNPKLEWLLDFLDTFPENRKVLIFYQYTVSGRRIAREIEEQFGARPVWLWSGTKDPGREIERFMNDPDCWPCVVNNQVGAYSLDGLQVANYEVFFESPVSVIDRVQAERRIIRQGQRYSKCFLYDPIVLNTVDEKILEFHREGKDLFKALLANPSRVLGNLR